MMRNVKALFVAAVVMLFTACSKERKETALPPDQQELQEESEDDLLRTSGHNRRKPVVFNVSGNIDSAVKKFRDLLGPLSLNEAQTEGRREITWENVALFMTNNNNFPGDYYNRTDAGGPFIQKTGAVFVTPGQRFRVSNNNFSDMDSLYRDEFVPFSPAKNFTTLGSNMLTINFKKPGTNRAGYVRGFGVVLSDVNIEGSTYVWLYSGKDLLGTYKVKIADTGGFSFLGVYFRDKKITQVKIKLGEAPIGNGVKDVCDSPNGRDLVVVDDLMFSNPLSYNNHHH